MSIIANRIITHDIVIKQILKYIKDNNIQKGDKLPTERVWAQMLGISRVSLREAMKALQSNQIVTIKQGSGIYFDNADPVFFSLYNDENTELSRSVLLLAIEMLQAREMLEAYAIVEAAKVLTHEQIKLLYNHEIEEYQRMSAGNNSKHPGLDLENLIINLWGNSVIINMHNRLNEMWKSQLGLINAVALSSNRRHADHLDILKAIEEKNYTKLKKAIQSHHSESKRGIDKLLLEYKE